MRIKHNKKRNTAFVFEALVREITLSVLKKDTERREKVTEIIRKYFKNGTTLNTDLKCYQALVECQSLDRQTSEKILLEAKRQKTNISQDKLFLEQSELIRVINRSISPDLFNNFVPNYISLATIDQIFSEKISPKDRVILEHHIVDSMTDKVDEAASENGIDTLTLNTFINKFNDSYATKLLDEQKEILTLYITSFSDNSLGLKHKLNEEIRIIRTSLKEKEEISMFLEDSEMLRKLKRLQEKLESFATRHIDEEVLLTILHSQSLIKELKDANND